MRPELLRPGVFPESCPLLRDRHAADEWVCCCTRYFYRLARSITGDEGLAKDALQNSWLKVMRGSRSDVVKHEPSLIVGYRAVIEQYAPDGLVGLVIASLDGRPGDSIA